MNSCSSSKLKGHREHAGFGLLRDPLFLGRSKEKKKEKEEEEEKKKQKKKKKKKKQKVKEEEEEEAEGEGQEAPDNCLTPDHPPLAAIM